MNKKILSLLIFLVIGLNTCLISAYAVSDNAYEMYREAMQNMISAGSWREDLYMTADMIISQGSAEVKTKVTLVSEMNITDYSESDLGNLKMSGSANMSLMGQTYAWDVLFENGIAHYEYTEPKQEKVDLKIEPDYFKFNMLTSDRMEKSSVSDNILSFIIPGDKISETDIAAIKLIPGVDNLNYDDIHVEVVLDNINNVIDEITMKFHASLTYQGFDAEVDYDIEYDFSNIDESTVEMGDSASDLADVDGMVLYSDHTNLSIRKDSVITLSASVMIKGNLLKDVSGITFQVEDPSILSVRSTGIEDNLRYVKCEGVGVGTTRVTFTDSNTGYTASVLITVYTDNFLSYTLCSVPTQYIEEHSVNIYNANGLYIDNYKYTVNKDKTASISFDVYNANYTYGVVEVHEADGKIKSAVLIKKMSAINTSLKKAVWNNALYLVRDIVDGDIGTYRQESGFSVKTPIIIKDIPQNGYVKISNDPQNSAVVMIVNAVDAMMSIGKLNNSIKNYDSKGEAFCEKLTNKMLKDEICLKLLEDGSDLQKDLTKNIAKKIVFSPEAMGDFLTTVITNLSKLNIEEIVMDTVADFGWEIGEDVFKEFSGPLVKEALNVIFMMGKIENLYRQINDFTDSMNIGSIYIQNQGGGVRASQQIKVESTKGFSDEVSLNVFKVAVDSPMLDILRQVDPKSYEKIVRDKTYTYNISLMQNGTEIQPDGEVTVYIPIPEELKLYSYAKMLNVYRVEDDGTLTEMDIQIQNGCLIFNTSHFSMYVLMEDGFLKTMVLAAIGLVIMTVAFWGVNRMSKRKKQTK